MAQECKLPWFDVPKRQCRFNTPVQYTSPKLPALLQLEKNRHYGHHFISRGSNWINYPIFSPKTQQYYQQKIDGVVFNYQTAAWYLRSGINERSQQYIEYGVVSTKLQKACWRLMGNQVIAVTQLFCMGHEDVDWFFLVLKVKNKVSKYDEDEDMVQIRSNAFDDLSPFHAMACLIHRLHIRKWSKLPAKLRDFLSTKVRFSNEDLVCF